MKTRRQLRIKRKSRIRARIGGTAKRPRLVVFRSNKALLVQIVDDVNGTTLAFKRVNGKNRQSARVLGGQIAAEALAKHITTVVFDRSGYRYHGVIQALADAARHGGLKF